ncbi:MAG: CDP-alcohol phosphatidyltransferase family protein [Deltaproteobacteria bacterium]|nr:MAG: CDP-alcohol phosphatidyltransferase family protein [Deltaproteobacteria bacterium]
MNLPNILTLFRVLGSFVFLYYSAIEEWQIAFIIFGLSALTDLVDGALARLLKQRTRLGAILDPMADKLLMFFSFMTLTASGYLPIYLTTLVVARDLFITLGLRYLISQKAEIKYEPTFLSKTTTCFQITTVFIALMTTQTMYPGWQPHRSPIVKNSLTLFVMMSVVFTALTFVQYFKIGLTILHETRARQRAL